VTSVASWDLTASVDFEMPRHVGVVPPPPGVTPDFDYSNPWLWEVNMVLISVGLVLSFIFLVLRIYTKTKILRKFGWEDGKRVFQRIHLGRVY
jgi:hypothetical protein